MDDYTQMLIDHGSSTRKRSRHFLGSSPATPQKRIRGPPSTLGTPSLTPPASQPSLEQIKFPDDFCVRDLLVNRETSNNTPSRVSEVFESVYQRTFPKSTYYRTYQVLDGEDGCLSQDQQDELLLSCLDDTFSQFKKLRDQLKKVNLKQSGGKKPPIFPHPFPMKVSRFLSNATDHPGSEGAQSSQTSGISSGSGPDPGGPDSSDSGSDSTPEHSR